MKKGKQRKPYLKLEVKPIPRDMTVTEDTLDDLLKDVGDPRVEISMRGEVKLSMAMEVTRAVEKIMKSHGKDTKEAGRPERS